MVILFRGGLTRLVYLATLAHFKYSVSHWWYLLHGRGTCRLPIFTCVCVWCVPKKFFSSFQPITQYYRNLLNIISHNNEFNQSRPMTRLVAWERVPASELYPCFLTRAHFTGSRPVRISATNNIKLVKSSAYGWKRIKRVECLPNTPVSCGASLEKLKTN